MGESEFPDGFRVQRIRASAAMAIAEYVPAAIAAYFREHPAVANDLLMESSDKRCSPSTFIVEEEGGFCVGWYSQGYLSVQHFSNLADAATDYLLFSLGKGRWAENSS